MNRILGRIEGDMPGPLVICLAAVHGNEPLGLHAFQNVFSAILNHNIPFKGKLVGIAGNINALQSGRRFIDYDLNRCWTPENVDRVIDMGDDSYAEDEELQAIFDAIKTESEGSYTLKVMADLHATSAEKGNFLVVPEELGYHPIIKALKVPVVLDLHKYLRGTLLSYYANEAFVSFAFEGGLIGHHEAYRLHTSGLWEILEKAGCVTHHDHMEQDHYSRQLLEVSDDLPDQVKVLYRHPVHPEDGFRMYPGFHNFQSVKEGQELAIDREGTIRSPYDGYMFMPLYQTEGDDGFFIVDEV